MLDKERAKLCRKRTIVGFPISIFMGRKIERIRPLSNLTYFNLLGSLIMFSSSFLPEIDILTKLAVTRKHRVPFLLGNAIEMLFF